MTTTEPTTPTPLPLPPLPRHPLLRPGTHAVRRDDRHLQVGLDSPARVVAPDTPEVRRLLDALARAQPPAPESPVGAELVARLVAAGLVVDGDLLADPPPDVTTPVVAGLVTRPDPPPARERLARRGSARVGLDVPEDLVSPISSLVTAVGCPEPVRAATLAEHRAGAVPGTVGARDGTVVLLVADGEPSRSRLDALVRDDVPHLVVSVTPDAVRVGPFVLPGATACTRCVDAHHAMTDPGRVLVVEQLGARGRELDGECTVPPRDPALVTMALGLAVGELVTALDGERPLTWSATVTWRPGRLPELAEWQRHPHCGCSWGDPLLGAPLP